MIGNATWCDVSIIWARDLALKVVQNGVITLKDVRVPEANRLQSGRQALALGVSAR